MSGLSLGTCVSNLKSVALTVLELLAFSVQNFVGHVTVATFPFGKIFGCHVRTVPGNTCVKFDVCSFNHFGAVAINAQKIRGSRDRGHAPFWIKFSGIMSGLSLGTRASNLKSVATTVLELSRLVRYLCLYKQLYKRCAFLMGGAKFRPSAAPTFFNRAF